LQVHRKIGRNPREDPALGGMSIDVLSGHEIRAWRACLTNRWSGKFANGYNKPPAAPRPPSGTRNLRPWRLVRLQPSYCQGVKSPDAKHAEIH
jgi:hypothetical protein